jgi:hypothetical protein
MGPAATFLAGVVLMACVPAHAQQTRLQHIPRVGDVATYRVHLTVHTELAGLETSKIGSVGYVKDSMHSAAYRLSWLATLRVLQVEPGEVAQVEEELTNFDAPTRVAGAAADNASSADGDNDAESARLDALLHNSLSAWAEERTVRFRISPNGMVLGLPNDAAPPLDESAPFLLNFWLRTALVPSTHLPERPVRIGDSWQEPRGTQLPPWTDVQASESDEWLDPPSPDLSAVRLHIVQQVSGRMPPSAPKQGDANLPPLPSPPAERTARFFADALNTVALRDARLLSAARSARRELLYVLPPVEGLPQPPRFRATLFAEVEIESCEEGSCVPPGRP